MLQPQSFLKSQILDLFDRSPTFNNFIDTHNKEVTAALKSNNVHLMHIYGGHLSGKTHLLRAWIAQARSNQKSAFYYDIKTNTQHLFDELRNLAPYHQYIALDNIDALNSEGQGSLFDLFNAIVLNNRNNFLLTASTMAIEQLVVPFREDLKTRIMSGLNLAIRAPSDDELLEILKLYTKREGISIGDTELNYLINHHTRNVGALIAALDTIVSVAINENRHVTIPIIKKALLVSVEHINQ